MEKKNVMNIIMKAKDYIGKLIKIVHNKGWWIYKMRAIWDVSMQN